MSTSSGIFCPSQKNVARRLQGTLTFHDPLARMTAEFWSKAFEHRSPRLFDLNEQRRTVVAHEQSDGAERTNASNTDCFEGHILEHVSLEQAPSFRRKSVFVSEKNALGVNPVPRIALSCKMINHRWLVGDAN